MDKAKSLWVDLKKHWLAALIISALVFVVGAVSEGYWQAVGSSLYTARDDALSSKELVNVLACTELSSAKVLVYAEAEDGSKTAFNAVEYRANNMAGIKLVSNSKSVLKNIVVSVKAVGKDRMKDLVLGAHLHTSFIDVGRSDVHSSHKNGITAIELPSLHYKDSIIVHKNLSRPADILVEFESDKGRDSWRFPRGCCDEIPNESEIKGGVTNIFTSPQCDMKISDSNTAFTDCPMYIGDEAQALADEIRVNYPDTHKIEFFLNKARNYDMNDSPMPAPKARIIE